jgi:hypothetical protein
LPDLLLRKAPVASRPSDWKLARSRDTSGSIMLLLLSDGLGPSTPETHNTTRTTAVKLSASIPGASYQSVAKLFVGLI